MTENDKLIERCAIAAFEAFGGAEVASGRPWDEQSEALREAFRAEAKAVYDIIEATADKAGGLWYRRWFKARQELNSRS